MPYIRATGGLAVLAATFLFAQARFDVAAIKPSDPNGGRGVVFRSNPGGGFNVTGTTVKFLIQQAYDVRDFQISGGPSWIGTDRYDIAAKAESSDIPPADFQKMTDDQRKTVQEQLRQRLQGLLEDRFQLKLHHDSRELPAYALVVAKSGSKLKESKEDAPTMDAFKGVEAKGPAGPRPRGPMMRMGRGQFTAQSMPIQFLAQSLSQQLGRPVLDKTGLKGNYDFNLEWTPDPDQGGVLPRAVDGPRADSPLPPESSGPTIFAALQEQLGLKLDSTKGPVDILVIERVEKPSEN